MDVFGVMFLKRESCKRIYSDPGSNVLSLGSLYISGFLLGLFEAYCTLVDTWGGLKESFSLISAMAKNPLNSFMAGFIGAILIWGFFTLIGWFVVKARNGNFIGVANVAACATTPLCVTILFPIFNYYGVRVIPFLNVDFGWLITLIAFVWVVVAEIRAITSIP